MRANARIRNFFFRDRAERKKDPHWRGLTRSTQLVKTNARRATLDARGALIRSMLRTRRRAAFSRVERGARARSRWRIEPCASLRLEQAAGARPRSKRPPRPPEAQDHERK